MNAPIDMTKFAAQVCGMAQPGRDYQAMQKSPDLDGLFDHEYTTSSGLTLRCYLEHESGIDATDVSQGYKSRVYLIYAFAGVVDVAEVLAPDVVGLIETEALKAIETEVV